MIYGKRIRLRAITRDDLPKFVEWLNDPEVIYGLMVRIPFSLEDEQAWFEGPAKQPQAERPLAIEIQDSDSWRIIGNTSLHNISAVDRAAEFGIIVLWRRICAISANHSNLWLRPAKRLRYDWR